MRSVVYADAEAVDELAAEPPGDRCQDRGGSRKDDGDVLRLRDAGAPKQPAPSKDRHDDDISDAVQHADSPGASPFRDAEEVDETEDRGNEPTDDASGDHVKRRFVQTGQTGEAGDEIEDERHCKHTEGKGDQHLMNRVPEEF